MSGVDKPYELLKSVTRGKKVTIENFRELAASLNVSDEIKSKLTGLTPDTYTGFASRIVKEFDPKF
jgi:adenylosuccinate lyase